MIKTVTLKLEEKDYDLVQEAKEKAGNPTNEKFVMALVDTYLHDNTAEDRVSSVLEEPTFLEETP